MKRLTIIRSSLIVVILAGFAVGALNLTRIKHKITNLQANLTSQTTARQQAETELAGTKHELATTLSTLKQTRTSLEATAAAEQKALDTAAAQAKRLKEVGDYLAKTREDLDAAQAYLARFRGAGLEPEQIVQVAGQIKGMQNELAAVRAQNRVLAIKLKALEPSEDGTPVSLPARLKAKVLAADPKWHFVVLDAGANQGMRTSGEVLVSRNGKLVARAKVSRVQDNRCVANLMSGWELGEVLEGDLAIAAAPQS
jgi:septal ring factor EnvC (AmiA/AmiB activator)